LFTATPIPTGAAPPRSKADGELIGIGSLHVERAATTAASKSQHVRADQPA